ncbi:MAG: enoyl-CoA hydratase-related protein [Microthrixaceae bacterium]|nr:enoyl-CoA hydratase/isomerase family protein [Microthrixaceae bacterium]MCO5311501.1 enoyl-CoA hydratase-related protein [Microthrixaceae bacterium]
MSDNDTDAVRDVDALIHYELADGIARITINAPNRGNALAADMRDRLTERFDEASEDLKVRAVVLRGAGERHFCTGADLGGPQKPGPQRPEDAPDRAPGDAARLIRRGWQRLVASVLDCEKPVIAAVNGTAAGGGAQLALACDLVVMDEGAKFIQAFIRRGIMPDAGGAYLLPRLVGLHRAKELMFLGGDVNAAEADRIGLVNRVVPTDELAATVDELAQRLAALPTRSIAYTKRLTNRSFESSREQSFDDEAIFQEAITNTEDCREGLAAFAQRRDPQFKGW